MLKIARQFLLATSYLTCLPTAFLLSLPIFKPDKDEKNTGESDVLSGLSVYLASVGLLIGLLLYCLFRVCTHMHVPDFLRGALLAVAWLALTNGLHFDGLMDAADGIFSHRDKARTIEIMSDPRAGNFAVMFGFCVFLIKVSCLAALPLQQLGTILILTPAWARLSESFAIGRFPYLKESGKGKIWHDTMRFPHDLFVGAIAPMVVLIGCARSGIGPACPISLVTVAVGVAAAFWINNKLGGHTGDTYGAVVELAETGGLLTLALAFNCLV
jgi:adenosylcobinamide-GDP ribazoletransferase